MHKNRLLQPQTEAAHQELQKMIQEELEDPRVIARGKMILACLQGQPIENIVQEFGVSRSMVFRWRARYLQKGISGLRDKPRCGKPPKYDQAFEKKVLDLLSQAPPEGALQWDGPTLARQLCASNDAIWRVLRKHHICLARQREWNVETHLPLPPHFPMVGGIYIGPPVWMITLLHEENPSARAQVITRERQAGVALRQAAEKAGGILGIQEAIRIMADFSESPAAAYARHAEIISFLNDTAVLAKGKHADVHVVGSASQLGVANWMAAHSEVTLFFHATLEDAIRAVREYLPKHARRYHNTFLNQAVSYPARAHPFIWKKIPIGN